MKFLFIAAGVLTALLIPCETVNAQYYRTYSSPGQFVGGGSSASDSQLSNQVRTNQMNIRHMQMQQDYNNYFNRINSYSTPTYSNPSYRPPGY